MADYAIATDGAVIRAADGAFIPDDPSNSDRQIYEAWVEAGNTPDPYIAPVVRRAVQKHLIVDRLTDAQLDAALAAMTNRQKERWRSPGFPYVFADDPEVLAMLQSIGADPAVILAP